MIPDFMNYNLHVPDVKCVQIIISLAPDPQNELIQ